MFFKSLKLTSRNIDIQFISMLVGGLLFFLPVLALYFEKSLFSVTNVAIIFSVEAIAFTIFEMPTGALADLFGRKRTMILANIVCLAGLVFLYIGGSMTMFVLYAILNSFARSLNSGTDSALIYDTLKDEGKENHYKKVVGAYHALWPLGASAGSVIGGYLASISLSLPVLATLLPISVCLILSFFIREPKYQKEEHRNVFKHMKDSLKLAAKNKQLRILMLGVFLLLAFGESVHLLNSLYFKFKQIPIEYFGYISAAVFGLSSLGHYTSHYVSEKLGDKKALILAVFGFPFFLLVSTFFAKFAAIATYVLISLFFGLRRPIIDHLLNKEVSSSKRATILSTSNFVGQLGLALFAPLLGYFTDLYTINTAYQISAVLMFSVTVLFFFKD